MSKEFDSNRFELSQETLEDAWQDLGQALVLRGDEPTPLIGEFPPENGQMPYQFRKKVSPDFVRAELLSESEDIASNGEATYLMQHQIESDDSETFETVTAGWKSHLPQTSITIRHGIVIERIVDQNGQHFKSYTSREYSQLDETGKEMRISPNGIDFDSIDMSTQEGFDEAVVQGLQDFDASHGELTIDDVEKMHAVARYVRGEL